MELFNLSNKRALITGGTHGLGMAMAEGLAKAGAELVITSTTPLKMENALDYYKNKGYKASGYIFDITDDKLAAKQVELIEANEGAIDILVNNAGIIKREMAVDMPIDDFRRDMELSLCPNWLVSE
jgi:gluconate 5-dehydrogenase